MTHAFSIRNVNFSVATKMPGTKEHYTRKYDDWYSNADGHYITLGTSTLKNDMGGWTHCPVLSSLYQVQEHTYHMY